MHWAALGVSVDQVLAHLAAEEQPQHDNGADDHQAPDDTRHRSGRAEEGDPRDAEQPLGEEDRRERPSTSGQDAARHHEQPGAPEPQHDGNKPDRSPLGIVTACSTHHVGDDEAHHEQRLDEHRYRQEPHRSRHRLR